MTAGVDAVVARMEGLLRPLEDAGDPRRFFLGTYLRTTEAVGAAIDRGAFEDPAWVDGWDLDFAELYLEALTADRESPAAVARPWRLAFRADPELPPEAHVLLGMNAHINFDLPQSLLHMIPVADFDDAELLRLRQRDHERIDRVLASRVAEEDVALQRAGGRRRWWDHLFAPANRAASRRFLREARRKVWAVTADLDGARRRSASTYAGRLADLEAASADRIEDILRPGPVLLHLAVSGFGITLPPPVNQLPTAGRPMDRRPGVGRFSGGQGRTVRRTGRRGGGSA